MAKTPKRKTISIAEIKRRANQEILNCGTADARNGIHMFTEILLMSANAYDGFNFVDWRDGGYARWEADGKPEDNTPYLGDQSKIYFH